MDIPTNDVELVPEKEKIKDGKEGCPTFHCDLYDTEVVHKVAEVFLSGLAAACVDNTTGGIFRSPASVAVEMRKEMIEYLTTRSENYVAESVILEGDPNTEVSDNPYDIISDFVDYFASSKRNFFSRVSGWLLSEKREDRVDDFVQEMETNGFWLTDRRETIAQTLVKNVDFKNTCHCDEKFNTAEELAEHVVNCEFRTVNCTNEGCIFVYCARHMEKHDLACPFKIIPCEQKCSESLMRREMDRHCITVCPMKLVNCPFYGVGCQSTVPRCMIQQHCSDELQLHLTYALKSIHKGAPEGDLKKRANQIIELSSGQLEGARDARSLTLRVRDLDGKLGPLEISTAEKAPEESSEPANDNTDKSTERSIDNKSTEPTSDKTVKFSEPVSDNADKSTEPTSGKAVKFSEAASENAYKSTEPAAVEYSEPAIAFADKSASDKAERAIDNADKSTEPGTGNAECAVDNADMSTKPAGDNAEKCTESARDNANKAVEVAIDKLTEPQMDNTDKFTEPLSDNASKCAEPASEVAVEFSARAIESTDETDKSIEPSSANVEKSTAYVSDNADKPPEPTSNSAIRPDEPASDSAASSAEPASKSTEPATDTAVDPASDTSANSNEPASGDADKSIDHVDKSTKSSEDSYSASEKPIDSPN